MTPDAAGNAPGARVTCAACGYESLGGARFCGGCGQPLGAPRACRGCGFENAAGQRFCSGCGAPLGDAPGARTVAPRTYTPPHLAQKILTSRAALEGERKQVTVLFADVRGSMELAGRVDPEEWHAILDRFFQILTEGVHRVEGTVNQYTGDGVMAIFGAPIAHEDHAHRACWAALALRDEIRKYANELRRERALDFAVRMGINSGEVVVGKIGDDLRMDYTAQGQTVGLAQRIEQLAEAGGAYLTEATATLVGEYFDLEDMGAFPIRGVEAPVRVLSLRGPGAVRTRLDVSRSRGFSRFVGRDDALATLESALGHAVEGRGQVIGVVADAGVGKSRLCEEFLERARAQGIATQVTRCVAHGRMIPLLPVLNLVRNYFDLSGSESPEAARERIAGRALLLDPGLADDLPILFDLLGITDPGAPPPPIDPAVRQRRLLQVSQRMMHARSRRTPAVLLVEDLHWIDGASEAFVESLVEATAATRTLFLANFRPEYHAPWMERAGYQQLPLEPLGAEAADALLAELLGTDPSVTDLAARIRTRTAGNPFFIEEMVRSLVEAGHLVGPPGRHRLLGSGETPVLPPTVQGVLAARIDRLGETEKAVLQTASVLGKEFPEPLLAAVAGLAETALADALHALVAAELLHPVVLYPERVLAFRHPLTQEVAYGSQLATRRRATHAAAARVLDEARPDDAGQQAALLAFHWEGAGEAVPAARAHQRAAYWLGARDRIQTLHHWRAVRRLLDGASETPDNQRLGLEARAQIIWNASVVDNREDEARRLFAEGRALAESLGTPPESLGLWSSYGISLLAAGAIRQALACLEEARGLLDDTTPFVARLRVLGPLTSVLSASGRFDEAEALVTSLGRELRRAPQLGAELFGFSPLGLMLSGRAWRIALRGQVAEAEQSIAQSLEVAQPRHDVETLMSCNRVGLLLADLRSDADLAMQHARGSATVAASTGSRLAEITAAHHAGWALLHGGDAAAAVDELARALETARAIRVGLVFEAEMLARLADALTAAGRHPEARAKAVEAIDAAHRQGALTSSIDALLVRSRSLRAGPDPADPGAIAPLLDEAENLIHETGAHLYLPFVQVERAALAQRTGDAATEGRALDLARKLFTEMGATRRAERLASAAASCSGAAAREGT